MADNKSKNKKSQSTARTVRAPQNKNYKPVQVDAPEETLVAAPAVIGREIATMPLRSMSDAATAEPVPAPMLAPSIVQRPAVRNLYDEQGTFAPPVKVPTVTRALSNSLPDIAAQIPETTPEGNYVQREMGKLPNYDERYPMAPMQPENVPAVSSYARKRAEYDARRESLEAENDRLSTPVEKSENSRLSSGLKGMLEGMAQSFSLKNGLVKNWDEFVSRLGGVGGGFVGGMVNDTWDENARRELQLGRNQEQMKQLDNSEKRFYDNEYRDAQTEYTRARPEIEQAKIDQRFELAQAKAQAAIDKENRKAAAEGGKFQAMWIQGKLTRVFKDPTRPPETVTDEFGNEVFEPTKTPVMVNGYSVTGKDALMASTSYNNNQFSAGQSYQDDVTRFNAEVAKVNGQLAGSKVQLSQIDSQLEGLKSKISSGQYYESDLQLQATLQKQRADIAGQVTQFESQLKWMRPPTQTPAPPAPTIAPGTNTTKIATREMIRSYAAKYNITEAQAEAKARAEFFIIQ